MKDVILSAYADRDCSCFELREFYRLYDDKSFALKDEVDVYNINFSKNADDNKTIEFSKFIYGSEAFDRNNLIQLKNKYRTLVYYVGLDGNIKSFGKEVQYNQRFNIFLQGNINNDYIIFDKAYLDKHTLVMDREPKSFYEIYKLIQTGKMDNDDGNIDDEDSDDEMAVFELVVEQKTNKIKRCCEPDAFERPTVDKDKEFIFYISNAQLFERIYGLIDDGAKVFLPQNLNMRITYDDLIIEDNNEHERVRKNRKWHRLINDYFRMVGSYEVDFVMTLFYEFTILNNKFSDRGYFITDNNREQIYVMIISKLNDESSSEEDKELITCLERFLEVKDAIDIYRGSYFTYLKIRDIINNTANSIDFVEEQVQRYISQSK
jgi:hypothetical protein